MADAISGRKTIATSIAVGSALHHVDVFDGDGAAIAEIDDEDGKADGGFRRRHGQHEQRENLAHQLVQLGREGDEVDVHRQQHQLDRHQDDDDVLAVQEDAENPEREQDRRHGQVMGKTDGHVRTPLPLATCLTSTESPRRRSVWRSMDCLRTPLRWRGGSTMAPIMAISSTRSATWNRYT